MTESPKNETLPESVEQLLSDWKLPEKSDDDWAVMADAVDRRVASALPARGEGDDWLFLPPLPLVNGEPRIADDAELTLPEARTSDHRSLKEIAREALGHGPPRSPTESGVQFTAPARSLPKARPPTADAGGGVAEEASNRNTGQAKVLRLPPSPPSAKAGKRATADPTSRPPRPVGPGRRWQLWVGCGLAAAAAVALFVAQGPKTSSMGSEPRVAAHQAAEAPAPAAEPPSEVAEKDGPTPTKASPPMEDDTVETEAKAPQEIAALEDARPAPARSRKGKRSAKPDVQQKPAETEEKTLQPQAADEPPLVPAADLASIPERPSIGAAQGAVGSVLGAARLCLAGQLEPSQATVTFGSDGRVRSVTVAGPASGTPAAGCIQRGMSRARVQPFSDESFSVRTTVRP